MELRRLASLVIVFKRMSILRFSLAYIRTRVSVAATNTRIQSTLAKFTFLR